MQEQIQQQHDAAVQKAALIEQLVKSDGWKVLMEFLGSLYQQEISALVGHKLDHDHYRKIGMLQAIKYIKAAPSNWRDTKMIQYLLHQGRAQGFDIMRKAPQYFFEGRAASQDKMARIFGDGKENPQDFHKKVYQQEG